MVAENDAVRRVAVGHEKAVRPEDGLLAVRSAEVNGGEFANHRAVADLDVADAPLLVLQILRLHADKGVREDLALLPYRRVTVDNRALPDPRAVADFHIAPYVRIGVYLDILAERGAVFNYRRWVYAGHFILLCSTDAFS